MKKNKLRKIFSHPIWFLIGGFIFTLGGVRYSLKGDKVGAIIYLITALFFLIGFIGQIIFNKPKK